MKIRLDRKFAELIDDVNVSKYRVGDVIDLPAHDAAMLVAEGWATSLEPAEPAQAAPASTSSMFIEFPERKKSA